ncbi:MAG TPA: hypothetical protein VLC79_02395 [Cellvibrio sp.]|nr:hypothetical protein [Cellvibrio sp.]
MSDGSSYSNKGVATLKLLFPSLVIRWLAVITAAAFLIAFLLTKLLPRELVGIVAGVAGFLLLMISMVAIPSQMVAFASSRTASFLSGPREILLVVYLLFSLLLSLGICWLWDFSQFSHYSPFMFLAVWLTTSLIFQASVYISIRWPVVHYFLYSCYLMLDDVVLWLEIYNPLCIALCILMTWVLFARWWLMWKPEKYKVNPLFVGMLAQQKMLGEQHANSWFYRASAATWLGSRLIGMPDGWFARSKRILPQLVYVPVSFLPGYFLMGGEWLRNFAFLGVLTGCGIVAQVLLVNYGLNLRRIWLCSPGARNELFSLLQKHFWLNVLPLTLLLVLVAISVCLFWDGWQSLEAWCYFLSSLFLLQLLAFHLYWWMYERTQASLLWANLACLALLFWWFLMSIATGFLIKWPASWQLVSPLWILIPEIILLALLYKPVRSGFARVNFARAG